MRLVNVLTPLALFFYVPDAFGQSIRGGTRERNRGLENEDLIFAEEFDYVGRLGPNPDLWTYDVGGWGWGNSELQHYTNSPENVEISQDGKLIIRAIREGNSFTSGRIKTLNKFTFKYGRVEASIKVPNLKDGLWPAFWTLGNNFPVVGWPACGEIDIIEMGHGGDTNRLMNRRVGSAAHWEHGSGQYATYYDYLTVSEDLSQGFHTFSLEWTPEMITTFVDGQQVWAMDISESQCPSEKCSEFHSHHFFLLNMAVGGTYTGIMTPSQITAQFPAEYEIDYIRLYSNEWTEVGGSYLTLQSDPIDCGCPTSCSNDVLDRIAGGHACRDRIEWVMSNLMESETEACQRVSNEFPEICGNGCDPNSCVGPDPTSTPTSVPTKAPTPRPTSRPTSKPSQAPSQSPTIRPSPMPTQDPTPEPTPNPTSRPSHIPTGGPSPIPSEGLDGGITCGCPHSCTEEVLGRFAGSYPCRDRIEWVMANLSESESQACQRVSDEFPDICGQGCSPNSCHLPDPSSSPTVGPTLQPTSSPTDAISYELTNCGCPSSCTAEILNRMATDGGGTFACRDRIDWVISNLDYNEAQACLLVSNEFPGVCGQGCNPESCG